MSARTRMLMVSLSVAVALFAMAGCSSEPTSPPAADPPAAEQNDGGTDQSGEGETLVSEKCSQCHSIDRVDAAVKDEAGWQSTVERMERNGLEVTAAEKATIIDWLTARDADR